MIKCHPFKLINILYSRRVYIGLACLFLGLFGLALYLTTPEVISVPPPVAVQQRDSFNESVIIIGGGAAGMFAAYMLEFLNVTDYTLLEASSSIGGRVRELDTFADVPLDLGAEWIHANPRIRQDLLLFRLRDQNSVVDETIRYQPQTISLYWGDRLRRFNWVRHFYREDKFRNTTWYSYLDEYVYPYIAENVTLQAVVKTIDYSEPNTVKVTTQDGRTFEGDRVIVATPVSILQQRDISFIPELPQAKLDTIDDVDMAPGLKVWVEFDERFYPDVVVVMSAQDKIYMDALFRKPSNRNVLALFEVGNTAEERVRMDDESILRSVLAELDEIFGGKPSAHYIKHHIQNWSAEPYIRGAYSYNQNYDMNAILEPVDKRIYFCGEYLHRRYQSTVHGAALSGRSVAERVVLDAAR